MKSCITIVSHDKHPKNGGLFFSFSCRLEKTLLFEQMPFALFKKKTLQREKICYYKIKQECDSKYPNEYVLTEDNGKLVAFSTNEGAHRIDWMANTYYEEIYKKLTKLNNGNYSNISEKMDLCVSIIYRRKHVYDINTLL